MPTDPNIFKMEIEHPTAANALSEYTNKYNKDLDSLEGRWVGTEKKRYDFVLKYLSGHSTSRGYAVHSFVDKNGAKFLAFLDADHISVSDGTEGKSHELKTGDCFTCVATVNRHGINTYKYGKNESFKETVLNRIKFDKFLGKALLLGEETKGAVDFYNQKLEAL